MQDPKTSCTSGESMIKRLLSRPSRMLGSRYKLIRAGLPFRLWTGKVRRRWQLLTSLMDALLDCAIRFSSQETQISPVSGFLSPFEPSTVGPKGNYVSTTQNILLILRIGETSKTNGLIQSSTTRMCSRHAFECMKTNLRGLTPQESRLY